MIIAAARIIAGKSLLMAELDARFPPGAFLAVELSTFLLFNRGMACLFSDMELSTSGRI
jgi:hypothetical protein